MSSPQSVVAILMLTALLIPPQLDHAQYFVHRVTLVGLPDGVTDKALRKACSSIEEGKVYIAAALDKAITALNKLGVLNKITRADCTVTRSYVDRNAVDITIRLKAPPEGKSAKPE